VLISSLTLRCVRVIAAVHYGVLLQVVHVHHIPAILQQPTFGHVDALRHSSDGAIIGMERSCIKRSQLSMRPRMQDRKHDTSDRVSVQWGPTRRPPDRIQNIVRVRLQTRKRNPSEMERYLREDLHPDVVPDIVYRNGSIFWTRGEESTVQTCAWSSLAL
jgi:hypothetical protein